MHDTLYSQEPTKQLSVILDNLGNACADLQELSEAKKYLERALVTARSLFGPSDANVGIILGNLGNVYADMQDHATARASLEQALSLKEQV